MDSKGRVVIERPSQLVQHQQLQQQQQAAAALRCPRCDSSNTKFCYYNNYSLSQPRHFCKACKRYWTRGGTLRNVPVGGGCRKNKRVKRSTPSVTADASSSPSPLNTSTTSATNNTNHTFQPHMDLTTSHVNPVLYGLPTSNTPPELDLSYPSFNSRVSGCESTVSGYDLHQHPQLVPPQIDSLGLELSSGFMADHIQDDNYRNSGFVCSTSKRIGDYSTSSNPFFSVLGSSSAAASPAIASLLASSLLQQQQQQKLLPNGPMNENSWLANTFHGMALYEEDIKMPLTSDGSMAIKEVKIGGHHQNSSRLGVNVSVQNQLCQMSSSDPSLLWNSGSASFLD